MGRRTSRRHGKRNSKSSKTSRRRATSNNQFTKKLQRIARRWAKFKDVADVIFMALPETRSLAIASKAISSANTIINISKRAVALLRRITEFDRDRQNRGGNQR